MRVRIIQLWRDGILVPRWQLAQRPVFTGDLSLTAGNDEHLRRNLRTATLLNPVDQMGKPVQIADLVDAAVLYVLDNRMSISGFERNEMHPTVAQTWLIELEPFAAKQKRDRTVP